MRRSLAALTFLLGGCGGALENPPPDAHTPLADASPDAGTDAPSAEDALGCGSQTCAADQICVVEYCGGGPVQCAAPGDGGHCPDGWMYQSASCPASGESAGCFPLPCVSPPPQCADRPSACGASLSCACIPSSVCDGISCATASGRTVVCGNA